VLRTDRPLSRQGSGDELVGEVDASRPAMQKAPRRRRGFLAFAGAGRRSARRRVGRHAPVPTQQEQACREQREDRAAQRCRDGRRRPAGRIARSGRGPRGSAVAAERVGDEADPTADASERVRDQSDPAVVVVATDRVARGVLCLLQTAAKEAIHCVRCAGGATHLLERGCDADILVVGAGDGHGHGSDCGGECEDGAEPAEEVGRATHIFLLRERPPCAGICPRDEFAPRGR
jgi:hypothetical protein